MEMKRLSGGNPRAAGYDERRRTLVVELTAGTFEYEGVTADYMAALRRRASSPWSFFRGQYRGRRVSSSENQSKNGGSWAADASACASTHHPKSLAVGYRFGKARSAWNRYVRHRTDANR